MWFILALLSAIFAALTSILAKIGINGVNSNLATAFHSEKIVKIGTERLKDKFDIRCIVIIKNQYQNILKFYHLPILLSMPCQETH